MNDITAQLNIKTQDVLQWAKHNQFVLIVASLALLCLLGLVSTERGQGIATLLLGAFLMLVGGGVIIAVSRVVEQLKAIRSELEIIRARIDTGLLDDIATDVTAMRTQMGKGVLGLFGM